MYTVYIISTTSNTIEVDQLNQLVPAFESDLQLELVQKNCSLAQLWLELIVAMACSWLLARAMATPLLPQHMARFLPPSTHSLLPFLMNSSDLLSQCTGRTASSLLDKEPPPSMKTDRTLPPSMDSLLPLNGLLPSYMVSSLPQCTTSFLC